MIVGVQATAARLSQESAAARDMIDRYRERHGRLPQSLAADNTYGNGELLQWLDDRGITPYIRVKENPLAKSDLYGIEKFTYLPEENCYVCPEGKPLKYVGINKLNRTHLYYSTPKRCRGCSQKDAVHAREVPHHRHPHLRSGKAESLCRRQDAAVRSGATRKRRKVEALFSRTEEPDRAATSAATQNQVRTRTVLPGSGGTEPQTAGAVP